MIWASAVDKHKRAYVRPTQGHSETRQIKAVLGAGASHVYVEGKAKPMREIDGASVVWHPDARGMWLRSLRRGDEAVVETGGRIGRTRKDVAQTIADLHARGARIIEARTGRRSDDPAVAALLMLDAMSELAGERGRPFTSKTARAASKKVTRRRAKRLPEKEARAVWMDTTTYPTNALALSAMPDWTLRTAYHYLGPRHPPGSHGGRPRSNKR